MSKKGKRLYLIYDGRAAGGDSDSALVMEVLGRFQSVDAAMKAARKDYMGTDYTLYSYLIRNNTIIGQLYHGPIDPSLLDEVKP